MLCEPGGQMPIPRDQLIEKIIDVILILAAIGAIAGVIQVLTTR